MVEYSAAARPIWFSRRVKDSSSSQMIMVNKHWHTQYEIYYQIKGTRRYFISNKSYNIQGGDIVFIDKNVLHKTTDINDEAMERFLINFDDSFIFGDLKNEIRTCFDAVVISVPEQKRAELEALFAKMLSEQEDEDEYSPKIYRSYMAYLFVFLYRIAAKNNQPPAKTENDAIEKAALYIYNCYGENITLNKLAQMSCMSPSYFSKRFKYITGMGISEYLNHVRINHAIALLCDTSVPVTDIAYMCGFNDSNYFSTVFKRLKGITPKKFRTIQTQKK